MLQESRLTELSTLVGRALLVSHTIQITRSYANIAHSFDGAMSVLLSTTSPSTYPCKSPTSLQHHAFLQRCLELNNAVCRVQVGRYEKSRLDDSRTISELRQRLLEVASPP